MIKKLRMKFVAVNMAIATAMLCVILGMVYSFTSSGLERESLNMMYNIASHPIGLGTPDIPGEDVRLPYFKIQLGPSGELITAGGGYYDLTDHEFLENLIDTALKSPKNFGVLKEYKLRYYRMDDLMNHCIVFADMSSELMTLHHLLKHSLIIGMAGFLLLLAISIWLSGWAVRPVERAWKQQKQFVADASHELKTPLTVILTSAQLAKQGEDQSRMLDHIQDMAGQMKGLLEQLLWLARADDGRIQEGKKLVDCSQETNEAALPYEPVFFEQGLELETEIADGIQIMAIPTQWKRLVEIFLDNALKYSSVGGKTRLILERTRPDHCRLTVSNQGEPIEEGQLKSLFDRFYRADSSRTRDGGFGLGLSIAKSIVGAHGGKIWAESKEGVNSFFVEL